MNHSFRTPVEELETYSEYKTKLFNKSDKTLNAILENIASSSLKQADKKLLLVKLLQEIQLDLFTKI